MDGKYNSNFSNVSSMLISVPYFVKVMDFLLTYYSRKQEFEADDFARKMHRASYLRQVK